MTFVSILESLIIGPIRILFEYVFMIANTMTNHPGLSIILLSLAFNILVLPLYKRADDMQEEARRVEADLREGVANIKKHFSGDERMMMLQTYYNQNNYKPTHALKGSISLLLQIPFFIAAYNFLSSLAVLQGASLGPVHDLSAPDGLIAIGGLTLNLLPVLMTLINVVSATIYLKGFPLKTKVQTYGLALFFLVFLYNSPAGLVFYWTLNNVFSLCKSLYYKLKNPKKVLSVGIAILGAALILLATFFGSVSWKRNVVMVGVGVLCQWTWLKPLANRLLHRWSFFAKKPWRKRHPVEAHPNSKLFLVGSLFLTLLVGAFIVSTYIASSPLEFVDVTYFYHPLWYVLNTLCLAAGTFMIWLRIFYWLAKPNAKVLMERVVWALSGVMMVNYMFFGLDLGILSSTLQYEAGLRFSGMEQLLNLVIVGALAVVLYLIAKRWSKAAVGVLAVATAVLCVMSLKNVIDIKKSVNTISLDNTTDSPHFAISTEGQNVVVIVLDRAMGAYVPYIMNEKPELLEKFDGFTYYSNTISFGRHTIFASPAMVGGYEYTPVELNQDDARPMVEKHNEALKVMPVLFSQNGYDVTVCDPPYANYQWIPDLSIYKDYPNIKTYNTNGTMNTEDHKQYIISSNYRNFFCFSMMKCMPLACQSLLYEGGNYHYAARVGQPNYANQVLNGLSKATGIGHHFMSAYNVLKNLSGMTTITEDGTNTFLMLKNDTVHSPTLLQTPDYIPTPTVDNTQYDAENAHRFVLEDGSTLDMSEEVYVTHYHATMAAFLQIADWLDYLREMDVYDNTRIILVADHGYAMTQLEELAFGDTAMQRFHIQSFCPLLMVKDFDGTGFTTSDAFMTNADVPTLATDGTIENPTNPFTGNPINSDEKYAHDQLLLSSDNWMVFENDGNTFAPAQWASVSENLWDEENWEYCSDVIVLKEHELP